MSGGIRDLVEPAVVVTSTTRFEEAVALLNESSADRAYLLDADGIPSVITDYALLKALLRGEACCTQLSCFAAPVNESLTPQQSLEQAAVFFRSGFRTEMAVIEEGRLVGVVRRTKLLAALVAQGIESIDVPISSGDCSANNSGSAMLNALRKIG